MRIVKVDINGTRGLALRDAKGSRVTVARIQRYGRGWLSYTGVHGRSATVYRQHGAWLVNLRDGLRSTREPHFPLLRSALAVARQYVGLYGCKALLRRIMAADDVLAAAAAEGAAVHVSYRDGIEAMS